MGGWALDVTQEVLAEAGSLPTALNSEHHRTAMGPRCKLRSVLQQDPINPE